MGIGYGEKIEDSAGGKKFGLGFAQQLGLPLNLTTKICLYKEWRGILCQQMMKKITKLTS